MTIRQLERPFELKGLESDGTFTGYGSVFNTKDSYRDIVMPGAFTKSLATYAEKNRKVPMLWQHDRRQPIGIFEAKEDSHGLFVKGAINLEVARGREAHALMKQDALTGLSIGYQTVEENWVKEDSVRELREVKLFEISLVTFPAHDDSRINSVKSIEGLTTISEVEDYLRDAGNFSRKEALALIARIKSASVPSDSGAEQAALTKLQNTIRSIKL